MNAEELIEAIEHELENQ